MRPVCLSAWPLPFRCSDSQQSTCSQLAISWTNSYGHLLLDTPNNCARPDPTVVYYTCTVEECTELYYANVEYPCNYCEALGCFPGAEESLIELYVTNVFSHSNCASMSYSNTSPAPVGGPTSVGTASSVSPSPTASQPTSANGAAHTSALCALGLMWILVGLVMQA